MQQQGINIFPYDNLRSFPSNAFQPRYLGNGAMLHPMQQNPHIPFVQQQYAAHNYGAAQNYGAVLDIIMALGLRPPGMCTAQQVAVNHFSSTLPRKRKPPTCGERRIWVWRPKNAVN